MNMPGALSRPMAQKLEFPGPCPGGGPEPGLFCPPPLAASSTEMCESCKVASAWV